MEDSEGFETISSNISAHFYQPRSRGDNMFGSVRLSVRLRMFRCLNFYNKNVVKYMYVTFSGSSYDNTQWFLLHP